MSAVVAAEAVWHARIPARTLVGRSVGRSGEERKRIGEEEEEEEEEGLD